MAFYKRRTFARRVAKKRTYRKRYSPKVVVRRPRPISSAVHAFKRMTPVSTISGNAAYVPYLNAYNVSLNQLISSSEFTALYDHYKINFVVVKFWFRNDPGAQLATASTYPKLYWYRDQDDDTAPGSLNEIRENCRSRVAVLNPNRPVVIKYKPNTLQVIYDGLTTSNYRPIWNAWLDCAVPATKQYGFKWAIDDFSNVNYRLDIETIVYFQCKTSR